MFSFVSGVQVWQTRFDELDDVVDPFMPMTFDPLSTKLVLNCDRKVYVFVLPCLIDYYKFDVKGMACRSDCRANPILTKEIIPSVRENQLQTPSNSSRAFPSPMHFLFRDIDVGRGVHRFVRFATPFYASRMAVMIHKNMSFSIIFVSFVDILSPSFVNLVSHLRDGCIVDHGFNEIIIKETLAIDFTSLYDIECIVAFPNDRRNNDHIAIFGSNVELTKAIFIDLKHNSQELVHLKTGMVYAYIQSKDGLKMMCLKQHSVLIIDLERKRIAHEVQYQVNLLRWYYTCHWGRHFERFEVLSTNKSDEEDNDEKSDEEDNDEESNQEDNDEVDNDEEDVNASCFIRAATSLAPPQILKDGRIVLLGWSTEYKKPILITPITNDQDLKKATSRSCDVMPCWALDDAFQEFSFTEFDKDWKSITSIGIFCSKGNKLIAKLSSIKHFAGERCKRFCRDSWTPQMARSLGFDAFAYIRAYNMALHKNDGRLKITVCSKCAIQK